MKDEKEQNENLNREESEGLELSSLLLQNVQEVEQKEETVVTEDDSKKGKKAKKAKKAKKEEPEEEQLNKNGKPKVFKKFKIKDIAFMAIISACMLLTGAVMPAVIHVPVFGIIHLALGLQCSLLPAIALLKVRKPGTLFLISIFFGLPLCAFNAVMCVCVILCGFITDALTTLLFHGYNKDIASIFASSLFFPLSLPLIYLYYSFMYSGTIQGEAVNAYVGAEAGPAVGISIGVIALCIFGSMIGYVIYRELKKAGVIKK